MTTMIEALLVFVFSMGTFICLITLRKLIESETYLGIAKKGDLWNSFILAASIVAGSMITRRVLESGFLS